ncbi:MAG: thioredoxin-disulfide reductase [Oscillospiraceae bacterium]|nr:thioredoxin-disulfide reductase [Oscillospiraceae bacterium]
MTEHIYDMIIVGGGPGGYTAALYAARAGMDAVVLEMLSAGGQMALTQQIENYPGIELIDGFELGEKMQQIAEGFGAKTEYAEVYSADLNADPKIVNTSEGTFYGRTVVIATGANPRALGAPNEASLVGRGVSYCASCDGMFFRGKTVCVVGGGNTAAAEAVTLSRIAEKVYLIHRRDELRATKIYHDQLEKIENVEFCWNSAVEDFSVDGKVKGVKLKNTKTGEVRELPCDGVFISIGRKPASDVFKDQVETDEGGYIIADESTRTNIRGVYAVGDVRTKALRQVVTACADGAVCVHYAEEFLAEK